MKRFFQLAVVFLFSVQALGAAVSQAVLDHFSAGATQVKVLITLPASGTPIPSSTSARPTASQITNRILFLKGLKTSGESAIRSALEPNLSSSLNLTQYLWTSQSFVAELSLAQVQALANSTAVASITDDSQSIPMEFSNGQTLRQTTGNPDPYSWDLMKIRKSDTATLFPNLDGTGVTIGFLDSGIDPTNPEFINKIAAWKDIAGNSPTPVDEQGHGTATAGLLVGGDLSGTQIGMAPGAQLLVGRIWLTAAGAPWDILLQGLDWIANPGGDPTNPDNPILVSNSWGGDQADPNVAAADHPACRSVNTLLELGTILVFSAGNSGPQANSIILPAACPGTVSVGATDIDDKMTIFSSEGPAVWKDRQVMAPLIVAPGLDVGTTLLGGNYGQFSGTSASAPLVAGTLALMSEAEPHYPASVLIQALIASPVNIGVGGNIPNDVQGYGRLDTLSAVQTSILLRP